MSHQVARLGRAATGSLARHVLGRFLVHLSLAFLGLQAFVVTAGVARLLVQNPHVKVLDVAAHLLDVLLVHLPIVAPCAVLAAAVTTTLYLARHGTLAQIALQGVPIGMVFVPVLGGIGLLCAVLAGTYASGLPQARYQLEHLVSTVGADAASLAVQLAEEPDLLGGHQIQFERFEDNALMGVRLTNESDEGALAVTARRARVRRVADSPFLEIEFEDGRLLRIDDELQLQQNLRFGALLLRHDVRSLGGSQKADLIELDTYTDGELDQLDELLLHRFERGIRPTRKQRRIVAGVTGERWVRTQSAALPLLFLVVALVGLATPQGVSRRWPILAVVGLCVVVLLPAQLFLESAAHRGQLDSLGLAAAPSVLVGLTVVVVTLFRVGRRRVLGAGR